MGRLHLAVALLALLITSEPFGLPLPDFGQSHFNANRSAASKSTPGLKIHAGSTDIMPYLTWYAGWQ